MDHIILKIENLSKQYRLGVIGTGTLSHDLNRWWYRIRGKEDPYLKIGETNNRSTLGDSQYVWALKNINFEVNRGEVLGIIGKNGAGKSTLLKILSNVTSPTTGSIKSKGRIASLLEVGTGFHPEMTGRENIFLNGAILGMTKKEIASKLDEIIQFSGVARYVDTPVKRYSSGMKVRLAFAVAAHLEPEILVVDEVLAVGDAEFQKKAIGKMQDISKQGGRTVLFVSHNMAAVQNLCTRALVINDGTIFFNGKVEEAIQIYLNESAGEMITADFKDRRGNGVVQVAQVKIYGESENLNPAVGKPITFEFDLTNPNAFPSGKIRFDMKIDNGLGQRIAWLSSIMTHENNYQNPKKIIFHSDRLILNSGNYYISTDIWVDNKRADWLQNAISFEVYEGDFYNFGKTVPIEESSIHMDYKVIFK